MQPSFKQYLPVAVMVGFLAAFSVFLTTMIATNIPALAWVGSSVWVLFISWACWFAVGAKMSRFLKYILSLTGGVIFGWLTLYINTTIVAPLLGDAAAMWALPITVFLVATSIVLLELTEKFEIGYAYFFAFAGYFAFLFGGFGGASATPISGAVAFWILLMLGAGFAIVSSVLREKILDLMKVPADQRKTIFDRG